MTDDEKQELAVVLADAVTKVIREDRERCDFCGSRDVRLHHRKSHEFIDGLMLAADKWQEAQWDVKKDVLKWVTRTLVMATIVGLLILAKKYNTP